MRRIEKHKAEEKGKMKQHNLQTKQGIGNWGKGGGVWDVWWVKRKRIDQLGKRRSCLRARKQKFPKPRNRRQGLQRLIYECCRKLTIPKICPSSKRTSSFRLVSLYHGEDIRAQSRQFSPLPFGPEICSSRVEKRLSMYYPKMFRVNDPVLNAS